MKTEELDNSTDFQRFLNSTAIGEMTRSFKVTDLVPTESSYTTSY